MALSFLYAKKDDVKKHLLGLDVSDLPDTLEATIEAKYIPWAQRDVDSFCGTNFDSTTVEEFHDGSGGTMQILRHRPIREILNAVLYIIPSAQWFQFKRWFYVSPTNQTGIVVARQGGVEPNEPENIPPYVFPTGLGFANQDPDLGDQTASFSSAETQYAKSDLFIDCSRGIITIPPRILFLESQAVPFWNYTFLRGFQNVRVKYTYGYSDPAAADPLTGASAGNLPAEITDATALLAANYILMDKAAWMGAGAKSLTISGVSKSFGEMPFEGIIKANEVRAKALLQRYKIVGV